MSDPRSTSADGTENDATAKEKIYPELARANLLRMRGEYRSAVDVCLSILKRLPEDLDAHTLIADIYSESGDLEQAEQWYELALELAPKDTALNTKLASVRERAQYREIAETADQLGLPQERPPIALLGALAIALVVVVAIVAYLMGQRNPVSDHGTRYDPVVMPGSDDSGQNGSKSDHSTGGEQSNTTGSAPAVALTPQDDRTLTMTFAARSSLGSHIVSAMEDPRTKVVTLSYTVHPDEDQRKIGAELARAVLEQSSDVITVTLRAIRDDHITFMADVSRAKVNETLTSDWQSDNAGSPDAWISYILSYEWTPSPADTTSSTNPPGASPPATATPSTSTGPAATPTTTTGKDTTGTSSPGQ